MWVSPGMASSSKGSFESHAAESTPDSACSITVALTEGGYDFDGVVDRYYSDVYRFALSLAGQPATAADLTQETFLKFTRKHGQIRDPGKIKSWLMTTVFREFNGDRRHSVRFPHQNLEEAEAELPPVNPDQMADLDGQTLLGMLSELDETFRAPLALFYLEDFSYQEIAEVLQIPIGTVMSRLSRGKAQLREALIHGACQKAVRRERILSFPKSSS